MRRGAARAARARGRAARRTRYDWLVDGRVGAASGPARRSGAARPSAGARRRALGELAHVLGQLARGDVGERDVPRARRAARRGRRSRPRAAARSGPVKSSVSGRCAADAGERAVDRADHVGERDLVGGPGEPVAAVGAAPALDDPGVAQLEQDVLQEAQRDRLAGGQPLALHRGVALGRGGELHRRPQGVVGLGRDAHAAEAYAAGAATGSTRTWTIWPSASSSSSASARESCAEQRPPSAGLQLGAHLEAQPRRGG